MNATKLKVTGMHCAHCAMTVGRALKSVAGVESAEVSLEQGQAIVSGTADVQRLIEAVEREGYRAELRG